MKERLDQYARIGLVHHLLYADSLEFADKHLASVEAFVDRDDIETLDCCLPLIENGWQELAEKIRTCGKKHITYATHLLPLRTRPLSSMDVDEQLQNRQAVTLMVEQAGAMGASGFIFASGGPAPENACEGHYKAFREFCLWLGKQLQTHHITALLEPFDTAIDKKFLYGPSSMCAEFVKQLRDEGVDIGIELDMAHVPLMGETFEQAIKNVAPYLKRVHLGNCVLRDRQHPRYGDTHPPLGIAGGEIDIEQITEILRLLLEIGYLNKNDRGDLVIEMMPDHGIAAEDAIQDNFERVEQAWAAVQPA